CLFGRLVDPCSSFALQSQMYPKDRPLDLDQRLAFDPKFPQGATAAWGRLRFRTATYWRRARTSAAMSVRKQRLRAEYSSKAKTDGGWQWPKGENRDLGAAPAKFASLVDDLSSVPGGSLLQRHTDPKLGLSYPPIGNR